MPEGIVLELDSDRLKRTTFVVEIGTTPPRRWTPLPGGVKVGGVHFNCLDISVTGVIESLDQSQPTSASITIANATFATSDLVFNAANRSRPITITKVSFDADWSVTTTEVWFAGVTGKPSIRGPFVTIACNQSAGRRGSSPTRSFADLMHSHRPPENQKVTVS